MNLKTLKKGLDLNQNITDKGGNFDYYIAKVGHLKKNIAIGKYSIFTEGVGSYKEVARIDYDGEIEFINEDTKESQWFEGLAKNIAEKYANVEDVEEEEKKEEKEEEKEEKKPKKTARDILLEMREKREKAAAEEAEAEKAEAEKVLIEEEGEGEGEEEEEEEEKEEEEGEEQEAEEEREGEVIKDIDKISEDDFEKRLAKIREEMAKIREENGGELVEAEDESKKIAEEEEEEEEEGEEEEDFEIEDLEEPKIRKEAGISKEIEDKRTIEEEDFQKAPNINLLKKYLKQGTKAGFPASKQFLFAIGYVFYSHINLFQKLFLSVLLLSSSIVIFFTSLFFLPIYLLEKANKKLIGGVKKQIKKGVDESKGVKLMKIIFVRLPITLMILLLYIPIVLFVFLLFLALRTISFSVVFLVLAIIITIIFSFGYLFYEKSILHLFHEEPDFKKYKEKAKLSGEQRKEGSLIGVMQGIKEKEKIIQNLDKIEQRQYDIVEAFVNSEHDIGEKTAKVIHKKIDQVIDEQNTESALMKELLISVNRKLITENKEITDIYELRESLENQKILKFFI